MNTIKLIIIFISGIGIGMLLCEWKEDCESSPIANVPVEETSITNPSVPPSSFPLPVPIASKSISAKSLQTEPEISTPATQLVDADLLRWGTRQGIMEISKDELQPYEETIEMQRERWATRQGIMELAQQQRATLPCDQDDQADINGRIASSKLQETDEAILQRWGTKQGVIEYARSEVAQTQKLAQTMCRDRSLAVKKTKQFYDDLLTNFDVVKFTLTNTSPVDRPIRIGDGNVISAPLPGDIHDHRVIAVIDTGIHPQGLMINPFNDLLYVANQLSDSVTVSTLGGNEVRTIRLQESLFPGYTSPVALAANTSAGSAGFGKVYTVNSVSNTVSVIDTNLAVSNVIDVGGRPVAIAFHPGNGFLYVANMTSRNITVIDSATEQVITTFAVGDTPRSIAINPVNGDIYIANAGDHSITIYNQQHNLVTTVQHAGNEPMALAWHPEAGKMFVLSRKSAQVFPFNPVNYLLEPPLQMGGSPGCIIYNPVNKLLYVGDASDSKLSIVSFADNSIHPVSAPGVNVGLAVHPTESIVIWSRTASNQTSVLGYSTSSAAVEFDAAQLNQLANYFWYNPALIEHLKIVVQGEKTLSQLVVRDRSITGMKSSLSVALSNYRSPQSAQNVYEVDALKGMVHDGKIFEFTIPGNHSASMLLYFKPLEREDLLNQSINAKSFVLCQN
jgi:YVTN family beta-propeller protein